MDNLIVAVIAAVVPLATLAIAVLGYRARQSDRYVSLVEKRRNEWEKEAVELRQLIKSKDARIQQLQDENIVLMRRISRLPDSAFKDIFNGRPSS